MIYFYVHVCVVLPLTVESLPSCLGADVTNLNESPSSFFSLPLLYGLGAGSIHFRALVSKKQCETRKLLMSSLIRY